MIRFIKQFIIAVVVGTLFFVPCLYFDTAVTWLTLKEAVIMAILAYLVGIQSPTVANDSRWFFKNPCPLFLLIVTLLALFTAAGVIAVIAIKIMAVDANVVFLGMSIGFFSAAVIMYLDYIETKELVSCYRAIRKKRH